MELEYIGNIEDSMECSGICKSALFYFSKSVYNGYPTKTCMKDIV